MASRHALLNSSGNFAELGWDPPKKMGGENDCELPIAFLGNEASVRRKQWQKTKRKGRCQRHASGQRES